MMATETTIKATLQQRTMHELKEFAVVAVYLYITLGAVILMKTAVLMAATARLHGSGCAFSLDMVGFDTMDGAVQRSPAARQVGTTVRWHGVLRRDALRR